MDVVSFCPLRVAALSWQPRRGTHALTVVCKATFELRPDESPLAGEQQRVCKVDALIDNDPRQSLKAANELVAFKRMADIFVVGHAHAPHGQPVMSVSARLRVAGLDKAAELYADRAPAARIAAADFWPLGRMAPSRAALLGRHAAAWDDRTWNTRPLPREIDGAFFNAAPADQRLAELGGDEMILLEHLHPVHARLTTRLARVVPHASVCREGSPSETVRLRCDTLCIDADQGLATLVWRGAVPLRDPTEPGLVTITLERSNNAADVEGTVTLAAPVHSGAPALPFVQGRAESPSRSTESETHSPLPRELASDGSGTVVVTADRLAGAARRSVLPFGEGEPEPIVEPEKIELTIEQAATIAAEIAEGRVERKRTLEAHGLRERTWRENERRWMTAIEAESAGGAHTLRAAFDAAYVARVESYRGPITLEDYARIVAGLERGRANAVLDALRIHRPALMPITRLWTKKAAKDMKLAAAAAEALRAARSA